MAKRSNTTKDALKNRAGWKDQLPDAPQPTQKAKTKKYKRKTYLMSDELIERIQAVAKANDIGVNEMHRYLVGMALEQLESGEHTLDVQVETIVKRTLGV